MSTLRMRFVALCLAVAGCAPMTAPPGTSPTGEYTDREWSYRLTIPTGWGESPAGDTNEKLRLRSADSRASASVYVIPTGSSSCRIAIEEWLPKAKAAAFRTTFDRTMRVSSGEISTVKGDIETLAGGRSGEMSAFCERGSAVIAVGLGSSHHGDISALIASFRYLDSAPPPTATAVPTVKKPTTTKKPPVKAARPPRPAPRANPSPASEPEGEDEILGPR